MIPMLCLALRARLADSVNLGLGMGSGAGGCRMLAVRLPRGSYASGINLKSVC